MGRYTQEEEGPHSPSFLLSLQCQLVPWRLSFQLNHHTDLPDPEGAFQPSYSQRMDTSPDCLPAAEPKKSTLIGSCAPMAKRSSSGPGFGVSEGPPSALEVASPSHPLKRTRESLGTHKRKRKKH